MELPDDVLKLIKEYSSPLLIHIGGQVLMYTNN